MGQSAGCQKCSVRSCDTTLEAPAPSSDDDACILDVDGQPARLALRGGAAVAAARQLYRCEHAELEGPDAALDLKASKLGFNFCGEVEAWVCVEICHNCEADLTTMNEGGVIVSKDEWVQLQALSEQEVPGKGSTASKKVFVRVRPGPGAALNLAQLALNSGKLRAYAAQFDPNAKQAPKSFFDAENCVWYDRPVQAAGDPEPLPVLPKLPITTVGLVVALPLPDGTRRCNPTSPQVQPVLGDYSANVTPRSPGPGASVLRTRRLAEPAAGLHHEPRKPPPQKRVWFEGDAQPQPEVIHLSSEETPASESSSSSQPVLWHLIPGQTQPPGRWRWKSPRYRGTPRRAINTSNLPIYDSYGGSLNRI